MSQRPRVKRNRDSSDRDSFAQREPRAGAGEQEEDGSADVGDPAREEESDGGGGKVGRRAGLAEEVSRVIERHDDHDDAANDVDRFEAGAFHCDGFGHGGHGA